MDKATAHVIERAKERFGRDLSRDDVQDLERQCTEDKAIIIKGKHGCNPTEIRMTVHNGTLIPVVYRILDRCIVSVLPRKRLFKGDGKHGKMGARLGRIRKRRERHSRKKREMKTV